VRAFLLTVPLLCFKRRGMDNARILVIDPRAEEITPALDLLRRQNYPIHVVADSDAGRKALESDFYQIVLLSLDLPNRSGLDMLAHLRAETSPPEVIAMTAQGSVATAVEAMRMGAYDFLVKPMSPERLLVTVRNASEHARLEGSLAVYQSQSGEGEHGFVGTSPAMQAVYRTIESAAASRATVFITGESGTGKDVSAMAIHQASPRKGNAFVALNCAAIPKDLIESEVFGHVKGAFTGATADRAGAATQADGGTLFLDEICEMSPDLQSKLLRFLQSGTFQRVGGAKAEKVDVRILCATNRDPWAEVEAGRFREDLYYRLHVIPLGLPPLRERGDDVVLIANHLLHQYAAEERRAFKRFAPEVERMFMAYDWPGNVRQLQNIIRNIVVLQDGEEVTPDMVPSPVGGRWARPQGPRNLLKGPDALHVIRPLAVIEREAIENAITACNGNVPKAAALLGVSPSTLYRKREGWLKGEAEAG